ncbi:MAG: hypothetical protein ACFB0C_13850 [Leptolyngbyaceae cyanobacterium]
MTADATAASLRKRASQGDPNAIAALLNQSFQSQGIQASVTRNSANLDIALYSDRPIDLQYIDRLARGLQRLNVPVVAFTVAAYPTGGLIPDWVQTRSRSTPSASFVGIEKSAPAAKAAAFPPVPKKYRPKGQKNLHPLWLVAAIVIFWAGTLIVGGMIFDAIGDWYNQFARDYWWM